MTVMSASSIISIDDLPNDIFDAEQHRLIGKTALMVAGKQTRRIYKI